MTSIASSTVLALSLSSFCLSSACHNATIAVRNDSNRICYTYDNALKACDQSVQSCQTSTLGFVPVDAAFVDGHLVFITPTTLYRCDAQGQSCSSGIPLKLTNATSVSGGSSGQVAVVSKSGAIALCDMSSCTTATPH
jgi:hypothetical protein